MPVIIFASAENCAKAIGCEVNTFHSYLSKQRKGKQLPKRYCIYQDDVSEDEKENLRDRHTPKLTDKDLKVIYLLLHGYKQSQIDWQLGNSCGTTHYHCKKIFRITGLDPRCFPDLLRLKDLFAILIDEN
jgi:DNA-binding NarL/FixJ family response regulator